MPQTDPVSVMAVQPELASGESVVWAGRPSPRPIFHSEDRYLIPFSLMWGGFAIFWEAGVLGFWGANSHAAPGLFVLWGIPFVVIGQYLIWGRFLYAAWKKKRTYYAVTNRRVIVVQDGSSRKTASAYLDTLPTLVKESSSGGVGTLRFAEPESVWSKGRGWSAWDVMAVGSVPVFVDMDDVGGLYHLVSELREKAVAARRGS